jgi:hypothetical protein
VIHLFCGYDPREAIGFHVFVASVLERASVPVAIHPLNARSLPQGSNTFTFSRFLVPHLMGFKGRAIFADACDMLMLRDVADLDALFDPSKAVQLVKHGYRTRNPQKYIGTPMQCANRDYPRKNWASLMLVNCEHMAWKLMNPREVAEFAEVPTSLLGFSWMLDKEIGDLPGEWNRLVDEGQPVNDAAVMHWTAGIPAFPYYAQAPGADAWHAQHAKLLEAAA